MAGHAGRQFLWFDDRTLRSVPAGIATLSRGSRVRESGPAAANRWAGGCSGVDHRRTRGGTERVRGHTGRSKESPQGAHVLLPSVSNAA